MSQKNYAIFNNLYFFFMLCLVKYILYMSWFMMIIESLMACIWSCCRPINAMKCWARCLTWKKTNWIDILSEKWLCPSPKNRWITWRWDLGPYRTRKSHKVKIPYKIFKIQAWNMRDVTSGQPKGPKKVEFGLECFE